MPPRSTTKTLSVVGRFRDQITGPVRKSFKNVRAAARTGIESFRKFARSTSGVALALAGVASAAAAVTKAVKTTSDTIDQLARVSNTSRNFAEDINEIRTATAQLAVDTGSKIEEVRRAFQAVGRQYRETADAIAITTEAVRLGVATSTDQEAAAKSLTVAMKAFQLQSKDAGGAAALLSQAVQTTGGRLEELDRSIGKIGPTITKAGVSFNETVAVLVAMGEAGIRGGEALEGTRTLLGKIVSPTEKAKEELRALGVEIEFGSLEGGKFRERLIQMRKAIDENSDAARILGLTGQSLNQFLLLSQNNAAGFGTALENLGSSAETFVETFDRSNTTISSNFQAMKNLALVGIEGAMLPAMKELNEAIGSQSGNVRAIQLRWSSYSAEVIARLKLTWETAKTIFLLMREAAISTGEHIGNAFALSSEIASAAWLSMKATFFRALSEMAAKMKSFVDGITKGPAGSALKAILGATGLSGIAGRVDGVGNALSGALGGLSSFTGQAFSENILEARELLKLFDQEARDIGTGSAARIAALVSEYNRSIENAGFALDSANATREKAAALEKRIAGEAKKGAEAEEKRAARVKELKEQLESIGSLTNFSQERANGVAGSASGRSAADVLKRFRELTDEVTFTDRAVKGLQGSLSSSLASLIDFSNRGKQSFGDWSASLGRSISAVISKLVALQAVESGTNLISSLFSPSVATATPTGAPPPDIQFRANGGYLSGGFRAFANGSPLVNRPTLGLVGEGRFNEAVIPLPDGRRVPVDMRGGGGVTIHLHLNALDTEGGVSYLSRPDIQRKIRETVASAQNQRVGAA